jgi:outer membrane protein insertion porin family
MRNARHLCWHVRLALYVGMLFLASCVAASKDVEPPAAGEETSEPVAAVDGPSRPVGPLLPVEIRFEGDTVLSAKELRQVASVELKELETGRQRRSLADDAAYLMEEEYRGLGYAEARVSESWEETPEKILVTIHVEEGPLFLLTRVVFSGNMALTEEELLEPFGIDDSRDHPFVEARARGAVSVLEGQYLLRGYRDVRISISDPVMTDLPEGKRGVVIHVDIKEGTCFRVTEVRWLGAPDGTAESLRRLARELVGTPHRPRVEIELEGKLQEILGDLGHAEAEIDIQAMRGDAPGDVVLEVRMAPGPRVRIRDIRIEDADKLRSRESFIKRRMVLGPGDLYTVSGRRESFRTLFRTGLFSSVEMDLLEDDLETGGDEEGAKTEEDRPLPIPDLEEDARKVVDRTLRVRVEELLARETFVLVGWGSYELLRAAVGFRDRNIFGTGKVLSGEVSTSVKGYGARLTLVDPLFLGYDVEASLPVRFVHRKEPSFTRREASASFLLKRDLGSRVTLTTGYAYKITDISGTDFIPEEEVDNLYSLANLLAQLVRDTRNDIFLPSGGYRAYVSTEYAAKVLGGEVELIRIEAGSKHFFRLFPDTVLGLRYETGLILPIGDQLSIPLGERFFNGGERSVRSFKESELGPKSPENEPVGGEAFNVATVELRQRLVGLLAGRVFFDYGNLSPNKTRLDEQEALFTRKSELIDATIKDYFRDFRSAVGIGFDYLLPIGPLRLDIAVNPDRRKEDGEDSFQVHFSLGMAF